MKTKLEKIKDIDETIDYLLKTYDEAKEAARKAKNIKDEQYHENAAKQALECVEYEHQKLKDLGMVGEEINVTIEENQVITH